MPIRKIEKSPYISPRSRRLDTILKNTIPEPIKFNKAEYITNNVKIRFIDKILFNISDYISPFIKKHPKIGNKILYTFEKIIKFKNNNYFITLA